MSWRNRRMQTTVTREINHEQRVHNSFSEILQEFFEPFRFVDMLKKGKQKKMWRKNRKRQVNLVFMCHRMHVTNCEELVLHWRWIEYKKQQHSELAQWIAPVWCQMSTKVVVSPHRVSLLIAPMWPHDVLNYKKMCNLIWSQFVKLAIFCDIYDPLPFLHQVRKTNCVSVLGRWSRWLTPSKPSFFSLKGIKLQQSKCLNGAVSWTILKNQ